MAIGSNAETVEKKTYPKEFKTTYYCRGAMVGYVPPELAHWSSPTVVLEANDDGTTTMPPAFLADHNQNCRSSVHEIRMDRTVVT